LSLQRIDARFLLPFHVERALTLHGGEAWNAPLAHAGVTPPTDQTADLVACGAESLRSAASLGARAIIVEGRARRAAQGFHERLFLAIPTLERPSLVVPTDRPNVAAYVFENWGFPSSRIRALRKRLLVAFPRVALALAPQPRLAILTREPATPFLIAAAGEQVDLGRDSDWYLVCGQGDELARGLFVVFPHGAQQPSWVVKFARVPGYREPFDRDARGLGMAQTAGGAAAERAPRLLGRFSAAGFEASIETAAVGRRMNGVLGSAIGDAWKHRLVGAVADWILRVAVETRRPASISPELDRLSEQVLPLWAGAPPSLLGGLETVPGVLQHNDLGAWNIVVDSDGSFTALDWESARRPGLPLWDLWYFLADVLPALEGTDDRGTAFRRLFRGESASSALLFQLTRAAVSALQIPAELVGRIASLCWLHHGVSHVERAESLERHARDTRAKRWPTQEYPRIWLHDPLLGEGWSAWRRS
jgi:hypothetical protein